MPQTVIRNELEELLAESPEAALRRESSAFDAYSAPYENRVVLFGAGRLGRKILAAIPGTGIQVVAFADNNRALWGTSINDVPVLQPAEAAAVYGKKAAFVVCIFAAEAVGSMDDRIAELRALGCETVVGFVPLLWKRPDLLLPHWSIDLPSRILSRSAEIRRCAALMSDDRSRREFLAQIRWRLQGDFCVLPPPETSPQYFPSNFDLSEDEVFVDCGAYDGDTLKLFLEQCQGHFQRAICFEPDPANFAKLETYVASLPESFRQRIDVRQFAIGERPAIATFAATGDTSSRVGEGSLQVQCVNLDGFLDGSTASFLKFDIEGFEADALHGASHTISRDKPVLAVCAYHTPSHVWELPLLIDEIRPGYRFFLRPYKQVWELVCYAVPHERLRHD